MKSLELCALAHDKLPGDFLIETKLDNEKTDRIKQRLHFDGRLTINSLGRKGDLAMLWKSNAHTEILSYSQRHILACITEVNNNFSWWITGFYEELESSRRELSWRLLELLQSSSRIAWFVVGDFNAILFQHVKVGRKSQSEQLMSKFHQAIERCRLANLEHVGIFLLGIISMKTFILRKKYLIGC